MLVHQLRHLDLPFVGLLLLRGRIRGSGLGCSGYILLLSLLVGHFLFLLIVRLVLIVVFSAVFVDDGVASSRLCVSLVAGLLFVGTGGGRAEVAH